MNAIISTPPIITTADEVTLRAVDQNAPVQAADCLSFPATLNLSTEKETAFVKEGVEATQANKSVGATDNDRDSQQEVPSPTPTTSTTTVYVSVRYEISPFPYPSPELKGVEYLAVLPSKTAQTLTTLLQVSGIFLKGLLKTANPATRWRIGRSETPRSTRPANGSHLRNPTSCVPCRCSMEATTLGHRLVARVPVAWRRIWASTR
jgi:hypothetical protein